MLQYGNAMGLPAYETGGRWKPGARGGNAVLSQIIGVEIYESNGGLRLRVSEKNLSGNIRLTEIWKI